VLGVLLTGAAIASGDLESGARAAAGAGILFAGYLLLAFISPRGMGMGDVKLAGVIGLMLGWFGWSALAVGTLAAFILGGLVGIGLILARRASRNTGIPFGPWMLSGAWVGILLGEPIARGYLALFGLD
jgi:leader peptidase (prepilin peptidase)/N-methyltransferase